MENQGILWGPHMTYLMKKKKKKGICKKCLLDRQRAYIVYGLYNLTTPEFPPVKENWALKSQEKSNKSRNPSQDSHKRS